MEVWRRFAPPNLQESGLSPSPAVRAKGKDRESVIIRPNLGVLPLPTSWPGWSAWLTSPARTGRLRGQARLSAPCRGRTAAGEHRGFVDKGKQVGGALLGLVGLASPQFAYPYPQVGWQRKRWQGEPILPFPLAAQRARGKGTISGGLAALCAAKPPLDGVVQPHLGWSNQDLGKDKPQDWGAGGRARNLVFPRFRIPAPKETETAVTGAAAEMGVRNIADSDGQPFVPPDVRQPAAELNR